MFSADRAQNRNGFGNMFGRRVDRSGPRPGDMAYDGVLDDPDVPAETATEELDVRDLPPPEPLQKTLEALESMDGTGVLVQANDREPQHLFPMLEERGYAHRTAGDDPTYTAIWADES
jgi:TusA-related sulfurtransferase